MGQIIVRNLDDTVIERLKKRAKDNHQSLEQSIRDILAEVAKPDRAAAMALSAEMLRRTAERPTDLDPVELIRRDRDTDHGREWS